MSMPNGHRTAHGYATVSSSTGGSDYRDVARKMTEAGYQMNHATARNVLLEAMEKFASAILTHYGENVSTEAVRRIAREPTFQDGLGEMIQDELLVQKKGEKG